MTTIFIVDDEEPILVVMKDLIARIVADATVKSFLDSSEALEEIRNAKDLDLIITDLVMCPIDGYQLAKETRLCFPEITIILFSGKERDALVKEYGSLFNFVIQKPDFFDMREAIRKTIN